MKKSLISVLFDLFKPIPSLPTTSLKDKTVLITGANTGLGFETAKHLARLNPTRLILACRNLAKGNIAAQRIQEETGFDGIIEVWIVDLADFGSVRSFIDRATAVADGRESAGLERLDLLVMNAGVAQHTDLEYISTEDGFEHTLQINNISQSWIVLRLMPLLMKTAETFKVKPRVVVVGSEVHYWGHIPNEVLDSSNAWTIMGSKEYCSSFSVLFRRYLDTKRRSLPQRTLTHPSSSPTLLVLNMFFVRGLNNRLLSKPVIVNCVNPGLCHSGLRRDVRGIAKVFLALYEKIFSRKTEDGGQLIALACISSERDREEEEESLRGAYLNINRVEEPSNFVLGEEGKKREDKLWVDLVDLLMDMDNQLKDALRASTT